MALFRFLIMLAFIAGIGGVGLYFAPDAIKEKALSYVGGSPYIPEEIKKEAERLYATPAMKREKLITELTDNLAQIQEYIESVSTSTNSEEVQLLTRSKEIVENVLKINADPTVIKQITDALATKVLSNNSCPVPR